METINEQEMKSCFLCLNPAPNSSSLKCDKCNDNIIACSQSHLKVHINSNCAPFIVKDAGPENGGRHFVSSRNIKALEVILIDHPAVIGPSTKTFPVCLECLGRVYDKQHQSCDECRMPLCEECNKVKRRTKLRFHCQEECDSLTV